MQRRSILDGLDEVGAHYEGAMRRAANAWSQAGASGQAAGDEWWTVVPETVRGWIVEGYYCSMIQVLESQAGIWRAKHKRLMDLGKSERKYRRLLTQAETAEQCRGQIAEWLSEYRRDPASFRGFVLTDLVLFTETPHSNRTFPSSKE